MEIQTLQCFIRAARCKNFTKAAEECHITQTAMSRKISTLENELGVILFYRDNRQVELTPAGAEFLSRASALVEHYDSMITHTKNVANGFKNSLKIGIGAYEHALIGDTIKKFCFQYQNTEISCLQFGYKALAEHLEDRLIDIMISTDQYLYRIVGAEYHILHEKPWDFVCSSQCDLAESGVIQLPKLTKYAMVTINDGSYDQIRRSYVPFGFSPYRFYQVNSLNTKILMVQANLGVATVPSFMEGHLPADICFLQTQPGFRPRKFAISYLKENKNPDIQHFVELMVNSVDKPFFIE